MKKKVASTYRKKKSHKYFFYLGCSFGFGFFLLGNYWISISLTHDEIFKPLIPFALITIPLFLSLFFGLACLISGPFVKKNISFILFFSVIFSTFEFIRGNLFTGFPWNLISYAWSSSINFIQILSIIGTYGLSMESSTFFCAPFILFQNKISKRNFFFLITLILFSFCIYMYGLYKTKNSNYSFDKNISIKVVSPNFSLKDYYNQTEIFQLERLIKISDPKQEFIFRKFF